MPTQNAEEAAMELDDWSREYMRLGKELKHYLDRFSWNYDLKGWKVPPTEAEELLDRLFYFQEAALINSGDIFGYVPFIIEHKKKFEEIGAKGCLAALEKLMPFYEEQQKLKTEEERNGYWSRTESARASAEDLAEDGNAFAKLLLSYAQKHTSEIGTRSK